MNKINNNGLRGRASRGYTTFGSSDDDPRWATRDNYKGKIQGELQGEITMEITRGITRGKYKGTLQGEITREITRGIARGGTRGGTLIYHINFPRPKRCGLGL